MNAMQRQAARKAGKPAGYPRVGAFADGGSVQGDVRKADKINVSRMPAKEADRVKGEESARERNADDDAGFAQGMDNKMLGLAARAKPKMTVQEYERNPIVRQGQREARQAEYEAEATGATARRVKSGTQDFQYREGGVVRRKK